jgi:hypothetical protein
MNTIRLAREVAIKRADHDARMAWPLAVEPNEVFTVQRDHRPLLVVRKLQYCLVRKSLSVLACFAHRQHIMTQRAQRRHHLGWEVLVRVKSRHLLRSLVLADLLIDLVAVRTNVRPRVGEIFRAQRGICLQQFRFRHPKAARLLKHPDGDARPHNPGLATAYVWR